MLIAARKPLYFGALAAGLLLVVALAVLFREPVAEQPVGRGPALPRAEFVGIDRCSECHAEIAKAFAETGHANTFSMTASSPAAKELDGAIFNDPERKSAFRFSFDSQAGLEVGIPGKFGGQRFPLSIVLGSGKHAHTFVTLIPGFNGETYSVEHRVSLFGPEKKLGLTPGHRGVVAAERVQAFGKVEEPPITRQCIGCHTVKFDIVDHQLRNVMPNVQCESCHGAGSRHVTAFENSSSPADPAIDALRGGNAAKVLRQIEKCGQCHRLPKDLEPADITPQYRQLVRFQPVGLMQSECFVKSGGLLACTTCHDPHRPLADSVSDADGNCAKCHSPAKTPHAVTCPVENQGCVECHMPRVEIHEGISLRDHWIRVRKTPEK